MEVLEEDVQNDEPTASLTVNTDGRIRDSETTLIEQANRTFLLNELNDPHKVFSGFSQDAGR